MAELLIRVVDRTDPVDPYKDVKLSKRGDVVAILTDGWPWSQEEQSNPQWRILRCKEAVQDCTFLLDPEDDTRTVKVGEDPMLQRRGYHLDIDHDILQGMLKEYFEDDERVFAWADMPQGIDLFDVCVKKPKLPDPNVLG